MDKTMKIFLQTMLLSIFSFVVFPGYQVLVSDQQIYLPLIQAIRHNGFLNNDFLVLHGNVQAQYSLFNALLVITAEITKADIYRTLFIASFIFRFILLLFSYLVLNKLTKDSKFSYIASILIMSGLTVYGAGILSYENFLIPRTINLSLGMMFFWFFIKNKKIFSVLTLILMFLIHPLSSIPFIGFYLLRLIICMKRYMVMFLLIIFFSTILLSNIGPKIDPIYEEILRIRNSYVFITSWKIYSGILFIVSAFFLAVGLNFFLKKRLDGEVKINITTLLVVSALGFFVSLIAVDFFKSFLFMSLQLSRSLIILKILSMYFFVYYSYEHVKNHKQDYRFNYLCLCIVASFIFRESLLLIFLPLFVLSLINRKILSAHSFVGFLTIALLLLNRFASSYIHYYLSIMAFSSILMVIIQISGKIKLDFLLIMGLILAIIINLRSFSISPQGLKDEEFMSICDWMKKNTRKESIDILQNKQIAL